VNGTWRAIVGEEGGQTFLFYSICGEQGLAAAALTFR
jgi:hypothetical protein